MSSPTLPPLTSKLLLPSCPFSDTFLYSPLRACNFSSSPFEKALSHIPLVDRTISSNIFFHLTSIPTSLSNSLAAIHPAHGRNSGSSMKVCVSSGLTKPLWPAAVNVRHGVKTQARLSKIFEKQHPESIILDLSKHTCASQPSSPQHAHCLQATQLSTGSH